MRVPREALLGEEGRGFEIAMNAVENGRLGVASRAIGLAQACGDVMVPYAKERVVFRQPIGKFQMVQEMISDMICGTEAARLLSCVWPTSRTAASAPGPRPRWRR